MYKCNGNVTNVIKVTSVITFGHKCNKRQLNKTENALTKVKYFKYMYVTKDRPWLSDVASYYCSPSFSFELEVETWRLTR